MDIVASTARYEKWLRMQCDVDEVDLAFKHQRMAESDSPFAFFRATYYHWAATWDEELPEAADAPKVSAIGDLHLENYGTWRDAEGRLCWGVNDFDEADRLPYTQDLVRLAVSAVLAKVEGRLDLKTPWISRAILTGYRDALDANGTPFVLEERHPELRALADGNTKDSVKFWSKLRSLTHEPAVKLPPAAKLAVQALLPQPKPAVEVRQRRGAGLGSLGRPRFVVLFERNGGLAAREAKAAVPPATGIASSSFRIVSAAKRSADPFYQPGEAWIVRRLAPQCTRIDLDRLSHTDDLLRVLWAMAGDAANVHLGSPGTRGRILDDLNERPDDWLRDAAKIAAHRVLTDWWHWCRYNV